MTVISVMLHDNWLETIVMEPEIQEGKQQLHLKKNIEINDLRTKLRNERTISHSGIIVSK